nr:GAF domain-containing sensor histidine kinase [Nannocystis sp. RBIL2]
MSTICLRRSRPSSRVVDATSTTAQITEYNYDVASSTGFLDRHGDKILQAWASEASRAASARGLSDVELKNLMPVCLAALTGGADEEVLMRHIESHLSDRIRWGFEVAEVVEEFAILERCIFSCAATAPTDERPSPDELARIFLALQNIMVRTTDSFQVHMQLDEQREKRYLRQLRTLADKALHTPAAPLGGHLKEMLAVIMEAMAAQCAALFLYDPQSELLVTQAAVGLAEDDLQEIMTSLDPATVTGLMATSEEPVAIDDVAATELVVSDGLRRSGIHSLLGVRLPRRDRIRGVMYVGTRVQGPFSTRELRRIEALGEGMTLHLENGQLHAELRLRIEELEAERALRERFTAILAHDLRGPLASAKMSAHTLVRLGDRAARPDIVGRIERNLERVDLMIRDLLDVSRMEAGQRLPLNIDWCDLREVAEDVVQDLEAQHGPRFAIEADGEVRGMWSRDELRRALWNLVVNALKYGRGDTQIAIRLARRGGDARVSVHNFGDPIPAEYREHIFDVFSQRRRAPQAGESWGLGLAFVRACAEAHGGAVEVESDKEMGTTFTITLPFDARPHQK